MNATKGKTAGIATLTFVLLAISAQGELVIKPTSTASSASAHDLRNAASGSKTDVTGAQPAGGWLSAEQSGPFLRLTESGPPARTTSVFTESIFRTDRDFSMRLDLRVPGPKDGAGGVAFFWFDAVTLDDYAKSADESGLKGYAMDLVFSAKDGAQPAVYAELVHLNDGSRVDGSATDLSSEPDLRRGKGWQTVQFGYAAGADKYTLSWGYDGSSFAESSSYTGGGMEKFPSAYFAVRAGAEGTGTEVRNIRFEGSLAPHDSAEAVPEPGTWAAAAILMAGAAYISWRKRRMG